MPRASRKEKTPGQRVAWSRRERDLSYHWDGTVGENTASKSTSMLIAHTLEGVQVLDGKTLREQLVERGYDLTTFRLVVRKLPVGGATKPEVP